MAGLTVAMFAFVTGVTVAGLSASLMQIVTGRIVGFIEPFVSNRMIARSLLAALAAGPMMLGNDALNARREGRAGWLVLSVACAFAMLWASATGIVVLEVASRMRGPLGS